jgi:hypothetical protein
MLKAVLALEAEIGEIDPTTGRRQGQGGEIVEMTA